MDIGETAWQLFGMARFDDMEGCGPVPRALEALGVGMLLAGTGLTLAAVGGFSALGGVWYGVTVTVLGLATRAAAYAVGAWEIEQRGVVVPESRPGRDGRTPATELELVQMFEEDMAGKNPGFVTMLEDQRRSNGIGKVL